jgi:hypothetical protein
VGTAEAGPVGIREAGGESVGVTEPVGVGEAGLVGVGEAESVGAGEGEPVSDSGWKSNGMRIGAACCNLLAYLRHAGLSAEEQSMMPLRDTQPRTKSLYSDHPVPFHTTAKMQDALMLVLNCKPAHDGRS